MANSLYTPSGKPSQNSSGSSKEVRDEFVAIEAAIDSLVVGVVQTARMTNANDATEKVYMVFPYAGSLTGVDIINTVTNTTTATVIDIDIAGTAVTFGGGDPTVGATDTAGTKNTATPTADQTFTAGQLVTIGTDGGGAPVMPLDIILTVTRTS